MFFMGGCGGRWCSCARTLAVPERERESPAARVGRRTGRAGREGCRCGATARGTHGCACCFPFTSTTFKGFPWPFRGRYKQHMQHAQKEVFSRSAIDTSRRKKSLESSAFWDLRCASPGQTRRVLGSAAG